jgi:UDP-N-acetylglucosamine transferase subunit ALG13
VSGLVLVMVGTDHHPFDRLVGWADELAERLPGTRVVVQHGASVPPLAAEGHAFLPHDEIVALLAEAAAVVCHGGPGTIMDARTAGHVPFCVPRDPSRGEHVDGHQQRFAALAQQAGVVTRVESLAVLAAGVEVLVATAPAERARVIPMSPATEAARNLLAHELDELVAPRARASRWARRSRVDGRPRGA